MRQGPLTVSALGADPPERSTHFHVSLLGLVDGDVAGPPEVVPQGDLDAIIQHAKKLNTRTLTFLSGENLDHALVWEGVGDLQTEPADEVIGQPMKPHRPEGDAEKELRRFIDDSVNLLSELELNERRMDEGLPPLNLLWPWGHGVRRPVPNLILKRGERAQVESASMRLAGLARLVGYRHGDRRAVGKGTGTRLEHLVDQAMAHDLTILLIEAPGQLRREGLIEELHWFVREMDGRLLKPLYDSALRGTGRFALIAPGEGSGLTLQFESAPAGNNRYPFDERALEERALTQTDAWTAIEEALKPMGPKAVNESQAAVTRNGLT